MKVLSTAEVCQITGRPYSTIYRWWKIKKVFPKPILHHERAVGWRQEDVAEWMRGKQPMR
ncbi:AlpA family phage regulatory protein [Psychromonas sp. MME2]|uniref:helix-turn-helix transcriptional regulator n=1 Tax=unclassified Psychromonas TaxID=2614957 RepID=UPI00339D0D44